MNYDKLNDLLKGSKKTLFYVAVVPVNPMGEVLVAERKEDGIWTTPAGGQEGDETPEETAIRECWEEAGIPVIPSMLEPLGVKAAPNGKPVHCFLLRSNQTQFSVKLDPDREVHSWSWYSREKLPEGLSRQKNANRLETISQALMKFYGLMKSDEDVLSLVDKLNKGGPGSGVQGHMTAKKPTIGKPAVAGEAPPVNKIQQHLNLLRNGAVLPGVHTKSGKPVVTDMEAARAQGYTIEDHTDAMNVNYNMAQKVNAVIEKMRMAKKAVPKEAIEMARFHEKMMRNHVAARDHLEDQQKALESRKKKAIDTHKKISKSVTQMGSGLGDRDLDIGSFAQTQDKANDKWMEMLHVGMQDFGFGDEPRSFSLPKGTLHLCKVDDGLYSGFFTKQELVGDGMLEDNAKVRIERQTIPELVVFMMAQEWIVEHLKAEPESPKMSSDEVGLAYAAEMDKVSDQIALQEKLSSSSPSISMRQFEDNEQKIRMLELISKLIG